MFTSLLRRIWIVAGVSTALVLGLVSNAMAQVAPPDPGVGGTPSAPPPPAASSSLAAWAWALIGFGIVVAAAGLVVLTVFALHHHREASGLRPRMP